MLEVEATTKRELLWMQHPRDLSEGMPEAFGLSGTELMASVTCCSYCSICRTFCICDELDICVIKLICSDYCLFH